MDQSPFKKIIAKISYLKFRTENNVAVEKSIAINKIISRLQILNYLDVRYNEDVVSFNNYGDRAFVVVKNKYAKKLQAGSFWLFQGEESTKIRLVHIVTILSEILFFIAAAVIISSGVYWLAAIIAVCTMIRLIIKIYRLQKIAKALIYDITSDLKQ